MEVLSDAINFVAVSLYRHFPQKEISSVRKLTVIFFRSSWSGDEEGLGGDAAWVVPILSSLLFKINLSHPHIHENFSLAIPRNNNSPK